MACTGIRSGTVSVVTPPSRVLATGGSLARSGCARPRVWGNIVRRELRSQDGFGSPATELGWAIFVERSEALLRAYWPAAMAGDYGATRVCLRVLAEQARLYGLNYDSSRARVIP